MALQFLAVGHSGVGAAASWGSCTHSWGSSWPRSQHSQIMARGKAKSGPSSAHADKTLRPLLLELDQQLLSSAHSGLWQESSLVMPSAVPAPGLPGPAKGRWEGETAPGEASAPFPLCKKWELRHSLDLSVQFCAGVKSQNGLAWKRP